MEYKRQVEEIAKYIKSGEKPKDKFKIGVEYEHFVIYKDSLKTVSYYGENGVGETLKDLMDLGWSGEFEGEYVLNLNKDGQYISLEPGSQLEFSIDAEKDLRVIEEKYLNFLREILPVLDRKNQTLIAVGYHPVTKIDEITLLPKERYNFMFNYFKTKGSHAHNMMKGSGSLQVSIDYSSEADYKKKFRLANTLAPILYGIFDNSFYFEGEKFEKNNLRTVIWNNCDKDRAGIIGDIKKDFTYVDYVKYLLEVPPIFQIKDGKAIFTGDEKIKDIFNPDDYKIEELEHLLTMVFPDTRTKDYIEIRMMDAIPYPYNLSAVALIKGIFYSDKNLDILDEYLRDVSIEDILEAKLDIIENGLGGRLKDKTILELGAYLVKLGKDGLEDGEKKYIEPIEKLLKEGKNLHVIKEEKYEKGLTRKEILEDSILSNLDEVK